MNLDLNDADMFITEFKKTSDTPGSSGSWEEEAYPPEKEYTITKITVENLEKYDPEYTAEVLALKAGDTIDINFLFDFDKEESVQKHTDNAVEVIARSAPVKSVKVLRAPFGDALEIGTLIYVGWVGEKPLQSDKGR